MNDLFPQCVAVDHQASNEHPVVQWNGSATSARVANGSEGTGPLLELPPGGGADAGVAEKVGVQQGSGDPVVGLSSPHHPEVPVGAQPHVLIQFEAVQVAGATETQPSCTADKTQIANGRGAGPDHVDDDVRCCLVARPRPQAATGVGQPDGRGPGVMPSRWFVRVRPDILDKILVF